MSEPASFGWSITYIFTPHPMRTNYTKFVEYIQPTINTKVPVPFPCSNLAIYLLQHFVLSISCLTLKHTLGTDNGIFLPPRCKDPVLPNAPAITAPSQNSTSISTFLYLHIAFCVFLYTTLIAFYPPIYYKILVEQTMSCILLCSHYLMQCQAYSRCSAKAGGQVTLFNRHVIFTQKAGLIGQQKSQQFFRCNI